MILDTSDEAFNRRVACKVLAERFKGLEDSMTFGQQALLHKLSYDELQKNKVLEEIECQYIMLKEYETLLRLAEELMTHFENKQVKDQ